MSGSDDILGPKAAKRIPPKFTTIASEQSSLQDRRIMNYPETISSLIPGKGHRYSALHGRKISARNEHHLIGSTLPRVVGQVVAFTFSRPRV